MSNKAKELIFEEEARWKLSEGIKKLADVVSFTLGPKGRSVGLDKGFGSPVVTSDGNLIVKDIELQDQYENMGVKMAHELASKIKEHCGDGTTTAVVLLNAFVQEGIRNITAGASPILLKRGIDKAIHTVIEKLKKESIPVKSYEETKNIATASASGDTEIGQLIADALKKVGKNGVVTIEEAKGTETLVENVEGMQFDRGYISPYLCTNQEKMTVEMKSPAILIVEKKIHAIQDILGILQSVASKGKDLLIIAEDIEGEALATLVINKIRGTLKVAAVKAPGFGDRRKAMLEDIAVITGGTLISEDIGMQLKEATADMLGEADSILITKDTTTIVHGKGDKEAIQDRIKSIENQIENTTSDYDKEKLLERKAKLAGGVAVIRVGAHTESELKQKKQAFEDSLHSTLAALEEGVVVGGGLALFHASSHIDLSDLKGDEKTGALLVKKGCLMPMKQIISNAGLDSSVLIEQIQQKKGKQGFNAHTEKLEDLFQAGIIDPTKVIIHAIMHAASTAGIVLLSEVLMGDAPQEDEKQ